MKITEQYAQAILEDLLNGFVYDVIDNITEEKIHSLYRVEDRLVLHNHETKMNINGCKMAETIISFALFLDDCYLVRR